MSDRAVKMDFTQEELKLITLAVQREIDHFHMGDMRKRNLLFRAYRRMLLVLNPIPFNLREDAKCVEESA